MGGKDYLNKKVIDKRLQACCLVGNYSLIQSLF
jgi:hypothetical protein